MKQNMNKTKGAAMSARSIKAIMGDSEIKPLRDYPLALLYD